MRVDDVAGDICQALVRGGATGPPHDVPRRPRRCRGLRARYPEEHVIG